MGVDGGRKEVSRGREKWSELTGCDSQMVVEKFTRVGMAGEILSAVMKCAPSSAPTSPISYTFSNVCHTQTHV